MIRVLGGLRPAYAEADNSRAGRRRWSWWPVEKRGRGTGRTPMAVILDFKSTTPIAFLKRDVAPGSTVYTDGLKSLLFGETTCPRCHKKQFLAHEISQTCRSRCFRRPR